MRRSLVFLSVAAALFLAVPLVAQLSVPEIPYDSVDFAKMPDRLYLGETVGVATNSKGNVFVYTRTGHTTVPLGGSRSLSRGGARLFEFDAKGTFVREIGQDVYGFNFAHGVRVDPQDNIWVIDEGSNMLIKFDPTGKIVMTMGRKPEALRVPAAPAGAAPAGPPPAPGAPPRPIGVGIPGDNFQRPTDVAWDAAGNIYVADGYTNARVAKFDKNGKYLKSWGSKGPGPSQFNTVHSIAIDA
jgi:hypothetical protein